MTLRAWVLAQLAAQPNLQVFDGAPDDATASIGYGAPDRNVKVDPDGRAHMYACLYLSTPIPGTEDERVCGVGGTAEGIFQVTAAGGDADRCSRAVIKVLAALHGQRYPGGGLCRVDGNPGPPRVDAQPAPSRTYLPLIFRVATGDTV